MRLDLHRAIRERLGSLNPIPTPQVTAELMAGIVKPLVERQREQEEAEKIIIKARDNGLPVDARAKPWAKELSQWQIKLLRTIGERLGDGDHPLDTIRVVVKEVVADVTLEFEAERAAKQDRELRELLKDRARYSIPFGLNEEGRELAIQAIAQGIDSLPQETPEAKLRAAADAALRPFRDVVARHAEEQRRRATRESVVAGASWKLPLGFPIPERDAVLAAARRAVDQQPEHADRRELEAARDRALEPFLTAHERRTQAEKSAQDRRSRAEARVNALLDECVRAAVAIEEGDGLELDGPIDRVDFIWEIKGAIRPALVSWAARINNLTDEVLKGEIIRAARRCVRKLVPEE
jgi:hypothetical protein